ncbi:hypothetical protein HDU76_000738 [Blyttiomyces sp. JEL0837]|nr:hypothetical protein HDU76_000738 [Blyttiomyces sp. JEL0837]
MSKWGTTDDSLRSHFGQFGTVVDAIVLKDRETGRSRGFGFVTFETPDQAQAAIDAMNEQELDGRSVRVNLANERPAGGNGGGDRGFGGNRGYGGNRGGYGGQGGYGGGNQGGYQQQGGYQGGYNNNGGEEGATVDVSKCPLYEKCPYVKNHADKEYHHGDGCPLQKGGCPYYDEHAKDSALIDLVTEKSHKCPLSGKCKFYDDVKEGKKVDLSASACPLGGKCPYYDEVKKEGEKAYDCPLEAACPHFKKDFAKKNGHAHHATGTDKHDARECPYLKKDKAAHAAHEEL